MPHPAIAEDGPVAGKDLTVEETGGEWPQTVIWTDPVGQYEYRLTDRSMGTPVEPVYSFVRTLPSDEG